MSKKMKRVAMDLSSAAAKARFKHQTLIQDYQELAKETEDTRHKLEATKQKKRTLLAEVRFLRRRYKYLLINKSSNLPIERELVQTQHLDTRKITNPKGRIYNKKIIQQNLPPVVSQKGRPNMGKEAAIRNTIPVHNFDRKETLHGTKERGLNRGKEAATTLPNPTRFAVENTNGRSFTGSGSVLRNPAPFFDLNPRESNFSGKEHVSQSRAPVFDLNQISREEEDIEDTRESFKFEDQRKSLIQGEGDEPTNGLKLSVCRNIGDGSIRAGKRKISWQDPVALRV